MTKINEEIIDCLHLHANTFTNTRVIGYHPEVLAKEQRNMEASTVVVETNLHDMTLQAAVDNFTVGEGDDPIDWTIITDGFDMPQYEQEQQYLFIFEVAKRILEMSRLGAIFKLPSNTAFDYNMILVALRLFDMYPQYVVTVKANVDGAYIFCITK